MKALRALGTIRSERQEENGVQQLFGLRHSSNELKIADGLPYGQLQLVTVHYSGERDPALLPLARLDQQIVILTEQDTTRLGCSIEQRGIRGSGTTVLLDSEHIDTSLPQTDCDGSTDVLVGIEPRTHRRFLAAAKRSARGDGSASDATPMTFEEKAGGVSTVVTERAPGAVGFF